MHVLKALILKEIKVRLSSLAFMLQSGFQPLLYILLFVPLMSQIVPDVSFNDYKVSYILFALPGIVIINAMMTGTYSGGTFYAEKITGDLEITFTLPASRVLVLLAKISGAVLQTTLQSIIILLIGGMLAGVLSFEMLPVFLFAIVVADVFAASVSALIIGFTAWSKNPKNVEAVASLMILPLMFLSSTFYSISNVPPIAIGLMLANPITQATDLVRSFMVTRNVPVFNSLYLMTLLLASIVVATKMLKKTFG